MRKATVTAAAPGPRPSETAARRAPTLRCKARPAIRTSGPNRRAAATAAANAIRPGSRSRTRPLPPPASSCDSSAAPPTSAATTTATSRQRSHVERSDAAAVACRRTGGGRGDDGRREQDDEQREPDPGRREYALAQRRAHRRPGAPGGERTDDEAREPADDGADERHGGALGHGQQPELPAARPEPGQAPPRRLEVAAHRAGGEDREREEERRRLTADEEEAPPGDVGVVLHRAKLLHRRLHAEAGRCGREGGARLLARADEVVDLPEPRLPRRQRPHPGVAAVRVRGRRCLRERLDPLRDDERGGGRPVVRGRLLKHRRDLAVLERVVGGREEVAEELARAQRAGPDLDDPEAGRARERALAAQPQHLAAFRCALAGQMPARQPDVAAKPLHARERDEMARDGALAEEDDRGRAWQADIRQPLANVAVERPVRLVVADRDSEPDSPHRARCGRDPLDRLRDAPVLGDLRAGEDADQDGRPDRDPAGGEQRAGRPAPHAAPGEADDVDACPRSASAAAAMPGVVGQGLRPCRGRRGPVCRPPPRRSTRRSARTTAGR